MSNIFLQIVSINKEVFRITIDFCPNYSIIVKILFVSKINFFWGSVCLIF